jgi:hypothetical protein
MENLAENRRFNGGYTCLYSSGHVQTMAGKPSGGWKGTGYFTLRFTQSGGFMASSRLTQTAVRPRSSTLLCWQAFHDP